MPHAAVRLQLQRPATARARPGFVSLPAARTRLDQVDQCTGLKRFRDVRCCSRTFRPFFIKGVECPHQKNDRCRIQRRVMSNVGADLVAVLARHVDVGQHNGLAVTSSKALMAASPLLTSTMLKSASANVCVTRRRIVGLSSARRIVCRILCLNPAKKGRN